MISLNPPTVVSLTLSFVKALKTYCNFFFTDEDTGESSDSESKTYSGTGNKDDNLNAEKKLTPSLSSTAVRTIERDDCQKKTRELYGPNETCYVMDAKGTGNIGRYLNVSCKGNQTIHLIE